MTQKVIIIHPGNNRDGSGEKLNLYDYLVNEFNNYDIKAYIIEVGGVPMRNTAHPAGARRAAIALATLPATGDDVESDVTCILTDLRHFCDSQKLNFAHLSACAFSNYCEEGGTEQRV